MKNTFGQSVTLTLFGESHGEAVGAVIDGLAAGITVNDKDIAKALLRRRPTALDTARTEADNFKIISGVKDGKTTGTPICIIIPNENTKSGDYEYGVARPSHADYTAYCKYHGFEDYRGGGHFSGRVTAAAVAAGAVFSSALENKGINIATHILQAGDICERRFDDIESDIKSLKSSDFPVLCSDTAKKINALTEKVKDQGDSIGGVTETAITGIPAGVGEPWFDSIESVISHIIFGIGGIKGIDFGLGFDGVSLKGSEFNDGFFVSDGKIRTATNNNGGINGGISNGMPIVFRCAVKPTPSIYKMQNTVDFINLQNKELQIKGRHDPAIIRRICPVIDALCAFAVCDMLSLRFGTDFLSEAEG